jgi:phosphoribosylanthranilate isomerase
MGVAVKICGLSTGETVAAAIAGGAAYVGFVFYPPSPRAVTPQRAAQLCALVSSSMPMIG